MIRPFLSLLFCSLALAACGNSVAQNNTGGEGGTGAGGTGAGGAGASGGTGGGSNLCTQGAEGFQFKLTQSDGTTLGCSAAQPGSSAVTHLEGRVTSIGNSNIAFDTCPPNADCGASPPATLEIPGVDFSKVLGIGKFIQIDVEVQFPWGCSNTLLVRNLPSWGGEVNPGPTLPSIVVAGSDGSASAPPGASFTIGKTPLGCGGENTGCGAPETYRFDVSGLELVSVQQGEAKNVKIALGESWEVIRFRNLRSYETGWCDDYWNWAYLVTVPDINVNQ